MSEAEQGRAGHVYHLLLRLCIGKSSFPGYCHPVSMTLCFARRWVFLDLFFFFLGTGKCIYRSSYPVKKDAENYGNTHD